MKIKDILRRFLFQKIINDIAILFWGSMSLFIFFVLILLAVESIFWLPTQFRYIIWLICIAVLVGIFILIGFLIIKIRHQKIMRYKAESCATEIGLAVFKRNDDVLNALQLENSLNEKNVGSIDLTKQFIDQVKSRLSMLSAKEVLKNPRSKDLKKITILTFALFFIISISFLPEFLESAKHWAHPRTIFNAPHPFRINNLTGDIFIMGGDSTSLNFTIEGKGQDSLTLEFKSLNDTSLFTIKPNEGGYFKYNTGEVFQNLEYRAFIKARNFWERWHEVSSEVYSIEVIDRPKIDNFSITVNPPSYSKLQKIEQGGNVAEIRGLVGSTIDVELESDMNIFKGFLKAYNRKDEEFIKNLKIQDNRAKGTLNIENEIFFTSHIFDERNIGNLNSIEYKVLPIPDAFPSVEVLQPSNTTELGSDFSIPIELHIEDDFGFSTLQIVFETQHPDYVGSMNRVSITTIPNISTETSSQDIFYTWDLSGLELMPEDEVKFHFELYDNDLISGPKKSISENFTANFPSLADLFARTEESEDFLDDNLKEALREFEEVNKSIDEIELKLLKTEKLEWEERQNIRESIDVVKKKLDEIDSLQETFNKIVDEAEKHNLFSKDLINKFKDLNELLNDLVTPEIVESMAKLQDSMDEMSASQLLKALNDFKKNTDAMELELDRFIEIFRRIRAEQKIDELSARLSKLSNQQKLISSTIEQISKEKIQQLLFQQERNNEELKRLEKLMEETSEAIKPYAKIPSEELDLLANSTLFESVKDKMSSTEKALQKENYTKASSTSTLATDNLESLKKDVEEIAKKFKGETSDDMARRIGKILQNSLFVSKQQEQLRIETEELSRNSPRLGQMASRQQLLRDQLNQLISSLVKLSKETFSITPQIGKAIGRATIGMNESLVKLEERSGLESARKQDETVEALNEAAIAMISAMEQIRESGSASGFEQFLERMREIANSQQGVNAQTLQLALGQMATASQEQLMQRLASDQTQLKKSIEKLIQEMRGSSHGSEGLGVIAKEMEEIINDFEYNRVNRRTIKRQERILTRMLHSQKSLQKQDMNEKRRAMKGVNFDHKGPGGLPEDLGQRRNIAIESLNNALKAGYSQDYQIMIRRYFNKMAQSDRLPNNEKDESYK